ncbi:MAG TPA: amino acid adenylation domain-containing protein, partial [Thermoanaerobaculia bacterium]|nr:amino acid adenylation domain-containing protein [Thermoanaerobaculia bacterium]
LVREGRLPDSVRTVSLAGEPLPRTLAERIYERSAAGRVLNLYGPSEDTTYSTWARIDRGGEGAPPIGRPLTGTRAYVLDPRREPAPAGVPGELYLGGAGLARGYLGRPELTAERFVPSPFGDEPGARLYRTGDRVRYLADGSLEFLGRLDHQVKLRGFRVEPGEVQEVLRTHPEVRDAAVLAHEVPPLGLQLVAWLTPETADPQALRTWLAGKLPEHMVPAFLMPLTELPLTPNGKLDRRVLPLPEAGPAGPGEAPRTQVEEVLAGLWADVLGREAVGIHDDFFELGGHSLIATRVASRVARAFGLEIGVRAVFEAPTVARLAAVVEAARHEPGREASDPALVPVPRTAPLPLSSAQRRLWFLEQLEPGSPAYHIVQAVRIAGPLSVPALAGSLAGLALRHEALRTTFAADAQGEPVQRIAPFETPSLPVAELSGLPEAAREEAAAGLIQSAARSPFDLAAGPLLRTLLLRRGPEEHELLLALHHIVSDGWSMGILVREVAALYAALVEGRVPTLPGLPVQYADYAVWQREQLASGALEGELAAWRERLAEAPEILDLPTDRPRPAVRSSRGGSRPFALGSAVSAAVRGFGRQREATPFMVLLAGFQALLSRYARALDVSVGTPVAGRRRLETEGVIGLFVNTLVVRVDLAGALGFETLLGQVRERTLEAYELQEVPFERLVEEISPVRSLSHAPLFQVLFALQNAPLERLALPGLTLEPRDVDTGAAKLDLSLVLLETGDGFAGRLGYDADLFLPATVERLAGHLRTLLAGALAAPDRPVSELPLLTAPERSQILEEWSRTASRPPGLPVHERFAEQARRSPSSPAVVCEEGSLTYGEFDREANRLARHLQALGVRPDVPVALLTGRSPAMLVGLLAVLKAGGAYVPLDPSLPAERLRFVLEETGAPVILTEARLAGRLDTEARIVRLDDRDAFSAESPEDPRVPVVGENLVYVVFTSGSTGRPKGVAVEHRQLANYVDGVIERLELTGDSSFATVSTLAADLGNTMIFPALVLGGCLHVVSEERAADAEAFAEYVTRHAIDCLKIVPSHLAALQATERPERGLPRRRLVLGGEASTWELVARLQERAPGCRIFNHYGPTETTVGVAAFPVNGETAAAGSAAVPLGRPLPGSRLYVLDAAFQPVPAGVPGELYAGGAGLARGYLRRPELTAERFIPAPFAETPGERLYRTGDLARFLPDGNVEFLGRADHQVKIRGFRIEPGEIAAVLLRRPEVSEAFVAVRQDATGERRLAAYVVPAGAAEDGLRAWLRERLPDYMIPAAIVGLDAIPRTANGKVDLRALPDPETHQGETGTGLLTPVEESLSGIWRELLAVSRVARTDDFFALGGHSLLATRLASRVRQAFRIDLPLRSLFQSPTLAGLAARIEEARGAAPGFEAPPIVAAGPEPHPPLSFAQERLWFLEQLDPGTAVYNLPYFARVLGPLRPAALAAALREVVRRHDVLRSAVASAEGRPVQTIAADPGLLFPVVDLAALPTQRRERELARLAAAEARLPFDLGQAPLLRAALLRLGTDEHALLLTLHHIVSDAWSRGVLTRELAALYGAAVAGAPSPLPALPVQYADFARWQRSWLQGATLERLLGYWRGRLGTDPPTLQLPTDRPRPAARSSRGGLLPFALRGAEELRALARREGASLFMVLQAAFSTLLHRLSGQETVIVGAPVANRNRAEIEPLVGFFVNTLALPARFAGSPSFRELIARTREEALGAYDHQDLPFERLVEEVTGDRSLGRPPLLQAILLLQEEPLSSLDFAGLVWTPLEVHGGTAKFDLTLALTDAGRELAGALEHDADLFDATTAGRFLGAFRTLLAAALAAPGEAVSDLPLLTEAERAQLLVEWNAQGAVSLAGPCLHEAFEIQAARTPGAVALYAGTERLTYAELDRRATLLAHRLCRLGV